MDKADQILGVEREKSQQKIKSRRAVIRSMAISLFLMLVGSGFWVASSMFAHVDIKGLLLLLLSLILIIVALYSLLHFFENNKLMSMIIRIGGLLMLGYTIRLFMEHYYLAGQ